MTPTDLDVERTNRSTMDAIILGVAHELNNPNAFIRMNTSNLKKMLSLLSPVFDAYEKQNPDTKFGPYTLNELRGKMLQLTDATLGATVRLMTLADKLKQSTSSALEKSSPISLATIIQNIITSHHFLVENCINVDFKPVSSHQFLVEGHALQLEQAISILMTNACDAIMEKFGEHTKGEGKICIQLEEKDQWIVMRFTDNGCGMDEATLQKIFTPYFTTKPQGKGEGLGLPLCKAVVERHLGAMDVKSEKGLFTEFILKFPKCV